jgi:type IV pilus assembly protein PilM
MNETEFNNKYYYKEFDFENINNDEAAAEEGLEAVLSEVLGQVSRYLDYFNSRHFGKTVDRVYVIGEYGMLKGLRKIMGYSFRTAVTIGMKPVKQIENKGSTPFKTVLMSYYSLLGMIMRGSKL